MCIRGTAQSSQASANCKNPSDTLWVPGSVGSAARFAKYWERYYFSWEGVGSSCKAARILRRTSLISQGIDPLARVHRSPGGCRFTHKGSTPSLGWQHSLEGTLHLTRNVTPSERNHHSHKMLQLNLFLAHIHYEKNNILHITTTQYGITV